MPLDRRPNAQHGHTPGHRSTAEHALGTPGKTTLTAQLTPPTPAQAPAGHNTAERVPKPNELARAKKHALDLQAHAHRLIQTWKDLEDSAADLEDRNPEAADATRERAARAKDAADAATQAADTAIEQYNELLRRAANGPHKPDGAPIAVPTWDDLRYVPRSRR